MGPMAVSNMQEETSTVQESIHSRAEMLNVPRIGSEGDRVHQALQRNIPSVPDDLSG